MELYYYDYGLHFILLTTGTFLLLDSTYYVRPKGLACWSSIISSAVLVSTKLLASASLDPLRSHVLTMQYVPPAEARGWLCATTPLLPFTSDRVAYVALYQYSAWWSSTLNHRAHTTDAVAASLSYGPPLNLGGRFLAADRIKQPPAFSPTQPEK